MGTSWIIARAFLREDMSQRSCVPVGKAKSAQAPIARTSLCSIACWRNSMAMAS
jgi:hypothetical protein